MNLLPSHEQLAYFLNQPNDTAAERVLRGQSKPATYVPGDALADLTRCCNRELKNMSTEDILREIL